uniref:Uncharacterized protein n=1 Tax=Acrobeloides nanus TaxID=290746 RepID=A0A914DES1_9BILA
MPATVKWHNLLKTLPNFLEAYNTVGYFSEQPIENMHAKTNSMKKRMFTRNVKKVQEWLIKNIWYENFIHDTKPSDKPLAPTASTPSSKIPKIVESFSPREQPVKEKPIREEQEPCSSTRTRETAREEQEPCSKYRTRESHKREQPVTRETTPEPTLQHVPSQLGDIFPHVPSNVSDFLVYPDVPQDDPGPSRQRKARGNRIAQSMLNDGSVRFFLH